MKDLTIDKYNCIIEYKKKTIDKAILHHEYQKALLHMNDIRSLNHELWLAGCFSYSEMKENNKKAGASYHRLSNTERRIYDAIIERGANTDTNEA